MSEVETVSRLKSDPAVLSGSATTPVPRNVAVDAYRGLVMLLMMGEVLQLARIAASYPGNLFWRVAAFNQTHVEWAGLSLHDMIQPSFSLLVGVALPYSIASRIKKGQPFSKMLTHTIVRSLVLIALGIFLRSTHSTQTNFTFEDTLTQIGLGYTFLFLLGFRSQRVQWAALGLILFGYWLAWALYPAPGPGFNWTAVGVPPDWHHNFSGFAAHWNKNSNLGTAIDQWFLNLFPRAQPFVVNAGGYLTSSFIPTLGTMILGLIAGQWLRAAAPAIPFKKLLVTGALCMMAAVLLHVTGICPIVKRIWTPSWTLFSGGIAFYFLAAFSWLIDVKGNRKLAFPLVVIGRNSIAAYCLAELFGSFIVQSLHIHLGRAPFEIFGQSLEPLLFGMTVLLILWTVLFWMYRRNIFIRI
jgi:heparan-alpha-glucosaminide N-acetyltransferase